MIDLAAYESKQRPRRRLVIVVRADPVICGHSGEARNLAEAARLRGFDDVHIVTWPMDVLERSGLPLKSLDGVLAYSPGITVERPEAIGDYRVPDGRYTSGMVGRLVELFTDGVLTVCLSLYLIPHAMVVNEALSTARATGLPVNVQTVAEAVGSDITNVVASAVADGNYGAAAHMFSAYLANDECVAVSEYTRELILASANQIDDAMGTRFAVDCDLRVRVSYPAIDSKAFVDLDEGAVDRSLLTRNLRRNGYILSLSRLTPAKGVDDLLAAYAVSQARDHVKLVVVGNGPAADDLKAIVRSAGLGDRVVFLTDVDDSEKAHLMNGSAAFVLPSKPRPEFTETFGIALVEKMLAGGGPVITTTTGGIPEAVGDTALFFPAGDVEALSQRIDEVIIDLDDGEIQIRAHRARRHALRFDRMLVFDRLIGGLASVEPTLVRAREA
jgi:glycosyltransferase involved in cell wall biosynthesis